MSALPFWEFHQGSEFYFFLNALRSQKRTAWGSSKTFNYCPQFFWKLLKSPGLEIQISSRLLRTNGSLINGLMCLFNVHKIIFQKSGLFFSSLCISKIYHLWQKDRHWRSLTKSTAEIISTRGCLWKKVKWKRNWLFIYFCSFYLDLSISAWGGRIVSEGVAVALCKACSVKYLLSPQHTTPSGPGDYGNCLQCSNSLEKTTRQSRGFTALAAQGRRSGDVFVI